MHYKLFGPSGLRVSELCLGTLTFGIVFQLTGSYRPALLALIAFFATGAVFLLRLDAERGIREAGNEVPRAF